MSEVWKDIIGYEGHYQVSNLGNVKSLRRIRTGCTTGDAFLKERILKLNYDSSGYRTVKLYKNGIKKTPKVHRLVMLAFKKNEEGLPEINHKNGIKTDNNVDNLEWISRLENMRHAIKSGLHKCFGESAPTAKLKETDVVAIKIAIRDNTHTTYQLCDMYKVSYSTINHIKNNRTWDYISI